MEEGSRSARLFAGIIALCAGAGLILQFDANLSHGTVRETVWIMSRFFTITTNLAIAIVFADIAMGETRFARPRFLAGLTLSILLVGIIYAALLQGLHPLAGLAIPANTLMHRVTPVLVPLYWLAAVRKGEVRPFDPFAWAVYPLIYLVYALGRGAAGDIYAYPFIDLTKHGWFGVATNVIAISAGFLLAGYAVLWLDRSIATGRNKK